MAKKQSASSPTNEPNVNVDAVNDFMSGEGWEDAAAPDIDGFFKPEYGPVAGTLVGRVALRGNDNGKDRDIALVRLALPARAATKDGDVALEVGQVLAVDIRFKLLGLLPYIAKQGQVGIIPLEKISIRGGKTMWRFTLKAKGLKAPPPDAVRAGAPQNMPAEDDSFDPEDFEEDDAATAAALS